VALRILIRDNERRSGIRPGLLVSCAESSRRSVSNRKMPPLVRSGFFPGHYRADCSAPYRAFGVLGFTLTRRLAATSRRIEFVILRTSSSSSVALHPLSRGRSNCQLRSSDQLRQGLSPCRFDTLTSALVPPLGGSGDRINFQDRLKAGLRTARPPHSGCQEILPYAK
jgi:hypothetical protein